MIILKKRVSKPVSTSWRLWPEGNTIPPGPHPSPPDVLAVIQGIGGGYVQCGGNAVCDLRLRCAAQNSASN